MTDDDARLQIGANQPPLEDQLALEAVDDAARKDDLVAAANTAAITDAETQRQVAALAGLIQTHKTDVDARRVARKRPFDQAAQAVQDAYKPIVDALTAALERLRALNNDYMRAQDRVREAERQRLADEQERSRRAAEEAARKAAEEAAAAGSSSIAAQLAALKAEDEARAAAERAQQAALPPPPVRTDLGTASRTTQRSYLIKDLTACLNYLRRSQRDALIEAVQPLVNRLGRARVVMPGVEVVEEKSTAFRR